MAVRPEPDEIHLSPRQAQIVDLLAEGRSDKEIALALGLSTATVRTYLQRMYRQYGSRGRAHLVAIAWPQTHARAADRDTPHDLG